MSEHPLAIKCKHCNFDFQGQFCSECGKPKHPKRIDAPLILAELASIFNFQKGIFFTIKELLIRPGKSIQKYINEDRTLLVKPISFIILCSLIYIILQNKLLFEDGYLNYTDLKWGNPVSDSIILWISTNYGLANIIMAFFTAFWVKILFENYEYNFFEILILLYFIMGTQMLLFSFFGLVESATNYRVLDKMSIIVILYFSWAVGQFFDGKKKINYLKGLFGYFLGIISFIFTAIILGKITHEIISLF